MEKGEFILDRKMDIKTSDGSTKECIFKGIYQGIDGRIRITVGHGPIEQNPCIFEDVK